MTAFVCNICSAPNTTESPETLHRDNPSCSSCGSNVRFRWTIHGLSTALFGESLLLKDFPHASHLKGIGLSDEPLYADTLAERLGYQNTFLHREPHFDLTDPHCGESNSLDFILATEVFEHIPPPVQIAFDNLSRLLKLDGFVLFSTPWRPRGRTVEHFPNLFRWTLTQLEDEYFLVNKTREGKPELFDNLQFHGGAGHTLEMRLFSQPDLNRHFQRAGLQPEWATESYMKYGIAFPKPWSIPCILRRTERPVIDEEETPTLTTVAHQEEPENELAQLYQELDGQSAHIQRLENQLATLGQQLSDKEAQVNNLLIERDLVKNSKWLKLGKQLNCGPKLSDLFLVILITMTLLAPHTVSAAQSSTNCDALKNATPQTYLKYLEGDRAALKPACIQLALRKMGEYKYLPAIPTLIQYLDFRSIYMGEDAVQPLGSQYPAATALAQFGDYATPDVKSAIKKEALNLKQRHNAAFLYAATLSSDLPGNIRFLMLASKQAKDLQVALDLVDVARAIADICLPSDQKQCYDALNGN